MKFVNKTVVLIISVFSLTGLAEACDTSVESNDQYVVNSDGTVTDNTRGLMWMRCRVGESWDGSQCTGDAIMYDWREALSISQTTTFAEHSDWYLPNVKELFTIVALDCSFPAVDETMFVNTGSTSFWSSSHNSNDATEAWTIDFYRGEPVTFAKNRNNFVRLVRKLAP